MIGGDTIHDIWIVNGREPLDLKIKDTSAVRWLQGKNGLAIVSATTIASSVAASKITGAVKDSSGAPLPSVNWPLIRKVVGEPTVITIQWLAVPPFMSDTTQRTTRSPALLQDLVGFGVLNP